MTLSTLWLTFYVAWIISEILIAILTRTRRSTPANIHDRGSMAILWLAIVSSITACQWISATHPPNMFGGTTVLKAISIALIAAGLIVRLTAVFSLGKAFSANVAIRESQKLNQSGVYSLVRHPSYLGMLLIFLAVGLHSRHWLSCAFAVIPPTAALLYRIYVEESALVEAFGDEYITYARRTKRLIPGLL